MNPNAAEICFIDFSGVFVISLHTKTAACKSQTAVSVMSKRLIPV